MTSLLPKSEVWGQENPYLNFERHIHFLDSSDHYQYHLIPIGQYGSLIVQQGFGRKWIIHRLDSQLNAVYTTQFRFASSQVIRHTDQVGQTLYIQTRAKNAAYHQLLMIDLETGDAEAMQIQRLLPMEYKTFHVLPPKIYMTSMHDRKPIVVEFDMELRRSKVLPGIYQRRQFIDQAFKDKMGRYVLVVRHMDVKKKGLDIRIIDPKKESQTSFFVANQPEFNPDFVLAMDSSHVLGTFYTSNMDYPQGIFSLELSGLAPARKTFFKDFSGYIQHLSPKEKQRYLRKKAKEVKKGKLPIIHQSMLVRPYEVNDNLVGISAENYHPFYENPYMPYGNFQGYWSAGSMMVGYQFNWVLTALADMEGNLIWNQTAARKSIKTLDLQSPTDFTIQPNWWLAAWPKDGTLAYFLGSNDSLLVDKQAITTKEFCKTTGFNQIVMERIIPWQKSILLSIGKAYLKEKPKGDARLYWILVKTRVTYHEGKD
jgi:hypothetical protein